MAKEESLKLVQRLFLAKSTPVIRTVVFAGIDHGNGCSRICVDAAATLAANTTGSVCIVDANLRSPTLPEMFGVTNHFGLTDALRQEGPARRFARQLEARQSLVAFLRFYRRRRFRRSRPRSFEAPACRIARRI